MNFGTIKAVAIKTAGRGGLLLKKYSPEIMMFAGSAGFVFSTVLACRATLKAQKLLEESQVKVGKIIEARNSFSEEKYSEQDYKKDLCIVGIQRIVDIGKLYAPAVIVGVSSFGLIFGGHRIMVKRNLALTAAYKAIEQSFANYRKRVVEEYGEDKDKAFRNGLVTVKAEQLAEDGTTKEVTKEVVDPNRIGSQYAKFFDEASSEWCKTPEYNLTFLRCRQNDANDILHSRKHIFLNEVYDMLGIPRTQQGALVGWVEGYGDDYVDFGLFDGERMKVRDFVNGYERSILLDFNVCGTIYDKI